MIAIIKDWKIEGADRYLVAFLKEQGEGHTRLKGRGDVRRITERTTCLTSKIHDASYCLKKSMD